MKKFNIIKKSRKKSKDIDEKIEYLDKELEKNGLREGMVTSKIYQGSTKEPNQDVIDFVAKSQGGYPLGLSAADGNHLGNATLGLVSGSQGVALAPPHPVSGVRRSAIHITSGLGNSTPLRPGQTTTIGFGDNPPTRTMGSALWFFDPNYNSGEGIWNNLEWGVQQGAWGFWDTVKTGQFTGIYFFNTNLSQHPSGDLTNKITGINFDSNGAIGAPETTVLTQNDLGDPGFLPIDIPLSKQGFDYLLGKTGQYNYDEDDFRNLPPEELANIFSDPESEKAQEAAVNIVSNEIKENKPETASKMEQIGKAAETFINYVAGTLPETIDNEFLGEKYVNSLISGWDVTRNYDADGKDTGTWNFGDNILGTTQPPIRQGNTITVDFNYDFKNNYQELYGEDSAEMNPILKGLGFLVHSALGPYSKDAQPAFGLGPVDPLLGAVFSAFISLGKGLGGAQHTPGKLTLDLSQIAKLNPQLLRDVWNKGLITEEEFLKLSKGEDLPEYDPSSEENFEYNKPSWFTFSHRTSDGRIFGYNFSGAFGELKLASGRGERGSMESGYGTRGYDMRTNSGGTPWTMVYDGTSMWDKPGTSKSKSDPKPKPKPYKPTPQGGRGGGQGNPTNRRGSGARREDVHYKSEGELLFESTGLGHFDPEVLNVDIEKLRQGIMPEFPKDPPPEMINGYSAKSKLAPKTIEGEPFIKITKKDLAKNHMLKDSEIEKFMKQIDAINKYIKQNPAELKYAMIRYPKDDPRLAQLNFKLDQMKAASDEYMETHFPENQRLFNKLQTKIKQNIELTDPNKFEGHKEEPKFTDTNIEMGEQRKQIILKHFKKPVKKSRNKIQRHINMKEVKKKNIELTNAKKLEEKRLKEEAEQIKAEYEKWKVDWRDELKLDEGMTTSGLYKVVLPSAGDTDLETVHLGVSGGHAPVNYGNSIANSEEDPNTIPDGTEYTALTNLEPMTSVVKGNENDWNATSQEAEYYWLVRTFHQDTQTWDSRTNGGSNGMFSNLVPGFKTHTMRNVQLSGRHSTRDIDHPTDPGGYHPTSTFGSNDEVGQPYTSSSNKNTGAGVVLNFNGPGSPRFIALKPVDATELDTIKVHALVSDTALVRDGAHSSVDCRPQIYYWAGNHPDFKKSYLNGSIAKMSNGQNMTKDGWRPINMKPNGDIDPSVDPFIIKYREDEDASGNKNRAPGYTPARYNEITDSMDPPIYSAGHMRVYPYSLKLPEWTQTKGARFMIIQHFESFSPGGSSFHVSGVRYQRKNPITSFARLDDPQASSFIRVGQGVGDKSAEQRRKRVRDMIKASIKYGKTKFGDGLINSTNID